MRKGYRHSKATKNKIGDAHRGRKWSSEHLANLKASQRSPETRAKKSAALKGKKHSKKHRANNSAAHKGKHPSKKTRVKMSASQTGRKHTEETKQKIAAAHRGKKREPFSPEWRKRMGDANRGRSLTVEHRAKISKANKSQNRTALATSKRQESPQERRLHSALRRLSIPFKIRYPVLDHYVADVYLPQYNLLLEADSEYYHGSAKWFDPIKQQARDQDIRNAGFNLQRISNTLIEANPVEAVKQALRSGGFVE